MEGLVSGWDPRSCPSLIVLSMVRSEEKRRLVSKDTKRGRWNRAIAALEVVYSARAQILGDGRELRWSNVSSSSIEILLLKQFVWNVIVFGVLASVSSNGTQ